MSNNSKISQISEDVFNNINFENRTITQVLKEKENFEEELEKLIYNLDNETRAIVLEKISKETEKGNASFIDSRGNINLPELRKITINKIKEANEESKKIINNSPKKEEVKNSSEIIISKEATVAVQNFIKNYKNLTNKEKKKVLSDFWNSPNMSEEEFNKHNMYMKLAYLVHFYREKGLNDEQIQDKIDKDEQFGPLSQEARKVKNGKTLYTELMEVQEELRIMEGRIGNLKKGVSDEKDKKLLLKEHLKKSRMLKKILSQKGKQLGIAIPNSEIEKRNEEQSSKLDILNQYFDKDSDKVGKNSEEVSNDSVNNKLVTIEKPEDIKELLDTGISKEDIAEAVNIFIRALSEVEEDASREIFQGKIQELQNESNKETITVLNSLSEMKNINKILKSDEERENLTFQLIDISEQIEEIDMDKESKKQQRTQETQEMFSEAQKEDDEIPILDAELGPGFYNMFEEMKVDTLVEHEDVVAPKEQEESIEENSKDTSSLLEEILSNSNVKSAEIGGIQPTRFSLSDIRKATGKTRTGDLKKQQGILKELAQDKNEKTNDREDVS